MAAVGIGREAPDFCLPGTGGRTYCLSDYRGVPVVVVFYPADNSPICTRQLNAYTAGIDQFHSVGAQVLAISPQDVDTHEHFSAGQGGFAFPLLADADRTVAKAYGVLGPLGFYRRSVFVVDRDGVVRYLVRAPAGLTFRPASELVDAVRDAESARA